MKRKFIICVNDPTAQQQDTITEFLKGTGTLGYWHWMSDIWLVTDPNFLWTSEKIRDLISSLIPGVFNLVIQIDGSHRWSGFGDPDMAKWLEETWK